MGIRDRVKRGEGCTSALNFAVVAAAFVAPGFALGAVDDGCMEDVYDRFGQGGGLNCTANDVDLSGVDNVVITDDGCAFVGDTVTFNATAQVHLNAESRHDIGIYLGKAGDALNGQCLIESLPFQPNNEDCTALGEPYDCCTGPGAGVCEFVDIDGMNDDTKLQDVFGYCSPDLGSTLAAPITPCNETVDCEAGHTCEEFGPGIQDTCGDLVNHSDPRNPVTTQLTNLTILCADTDGDGTVDLPNCQSWRQPGNNDLCLTPIAAFPGAPSKCRCGEINVLDIPVPKTLQVVKALEPVDSNALFDLDIDGGLPEALDVGDGGQTPKVVVTEGLHTVSEAAGTDTDLSLYFNNIVCEDQVGRCVDDPSVHCLTSFACDNADDGLQNGSDTCDLTPTIVANCTDCTSLDLTIPSRQSDIVCTVTNTYKCLGVDCSSWDSICGAGVCELTTGLCYTDPTTHYGQLCRIGSGDVCDPDEVCDGIDIECPVDVVAPSTTVCNLGSGDICDPDELCTALPGQACPTDDIAACAIQTRSARAPPAPRAHQTRSSLPPHCATRDLVMPAIQTSSVQA